MVIGGSEEDVGSTIVAAVAELPFEVVDGTEVVHHWEIRQGLYVRSRDGRRRPGPGQWYRATRQVRGRKSGNEAFAIGIATTGKLKPSKATSLIASWLGDW